MKFHLTLLLSAFCLSSPILPAGEDDAIPPALEEWKAWVLADLPDQDAVPAYDNFATKLPIWASLLNIEIAEDGGSFNLTGAAYADGMLTLPGGSGVWPQQVRLNGEAVPVKQHGPRPAILVEAGDFTIEGEWQWAEAPQLIPVPPSIGVVELSRGGESTRLPERTQQGDLRLRQAAATRTVTEADSIEPKVYRVIRDGMPMQLETQVELRVTGQSREESLGNILPEGWRVSSVEAPIPAAVGRSGELRAQVRPGTWTITIQAFSSSPVTEFALVQPAKAVVEEEFITLDTDPDFRIIELRGITQIDASQTTLPNEWKGFPAFRWASGEPFQIVESFRGEGDQQSTGLTVNRTFWLDQEGGSLIFQDEVSGSLEDQWRLDVLPGQELGAVRMNGEGQLVTKNPEGGSEGVEVRSSSIDLEAIGSIPDSTGFPAGGWAAETESVKSTLHLSPGWRLFGVSGADWTSGDWLSQWDLPAVAIIIVLTAVICYLYGWGIGLLALVTLTLTFHESGAPIAVWFMVLVVGVIRHYVKKIPAGASQTIGGLMAAVFALIALPFVLKQGQAALFPQLERSSSSASYSSDGFGGVSLSTSFPASRQVVSEQAAFKSKVFKSKDFYNLKQDSKARIQTGPGVPRWTWRSARFGWSGDIDPSHQVKLHLIPPAVHRLLLAAQVIFVLLLGWLLLRLKPRLVRPKRKKPAAAMAALAATLFVVAAPEASAQEAPEAPPSYLLDELKERLTRAPDAFPGAASIPHYSISLEGEAFNSETEIHALERCAVPLPGKVSDWGPLSVEVDGAPAAAMMRSDGYLWIVLDPGVHQVVTRGVLASDRSWTWTAHLKPQKVVVQASDWSVTGIRPDGSPENQVFFSRQTTQEAKKASVLERKDYASAVRVTRKLELGLVWGITTTVKRLTPTGQALSVTVPTIANERITSTHVEEKAGGIPIRFGPEDTEVTWQSALNPVNELSLKAVENPSMNEVWEVTASPVWNLSFAGLPPVVREEDGFLTPTWRPWPGESAELSILRPRAVQGETITVHSVSHSVSFDRRIRESSLRLEIEASLGQELPIALPADSEIRSLTIDKADYPARTEGGQLILPVKPGNQTIAISWREKHQIQLEETTAAIDLGIASSNISVGMNPPSSRWVLWADGPLRGPVVLMWPFLVLLLVAAFFLSRWQHSSFSFPEWAIMLVGLSQAPAAALVYLAFYLCVLAFRGREDFARTNAAVFNLTQVFLFFGAFPVILIAGFCVSKGLTGNPGMLISNAENYPGSRLAWFEPKSEGPLPVAGFFSVSVWWFRGLMMLWTLWLAWKLLRWIPMAWSQVQVGGWVKDFGILKKKEPASDDAQ